MVLAFSGDHHISAKIDPSGWAWLVIGRKLFIWRYVPSATNKVGIHHFSFFFFKYNCVMLLLIILLFRSNEKFNLE